MTRTSTTRLRGFALVRDDTVPLYRQVCEHIRAAIRAGQLRPGDRLPSTRSLAERFGTARGTMDAAYAILAGEGYLVGRGPAGTVVSADLDSRAIPAAPSTPRVAPPAPRTAVHAPRPFQMGLPALDAFPRKVWSRLVARQARAVARGHCRIPCDVPRGALYCGTDPHHQRVPGRRKPRCERAVATGRQGLD